MTVALFGVPWDGSSSWRSGAADGPGAIRAELERARSYSNMTTELGVDLDAPGMLVDAGDVERPESSVAMRAATEAQVRELLEADRRPLMLGGDHSVTYPALRAAHAVHGLLDVLHFDAHPDLYPELAGDRYSHACPFARALEDGLIGRLVQVGIRTLNAPQQAVAEHHGVEQVEMRRWTGPPVLTFAHPVYISVDVDALDPAFAPGVSHPEPGGLSVRDVVTTIQQIDGRCVAADLVEYNPLADDGGRTAPVCFKLVKELSGALLR